jgi:hypothetical protein
VGTVVYVRIIKEFAFVVANDVRHFLSLRQFAPEDVVRITIGTNIEFTPDKRPTTEHPDATRAVILD